MPKVILRPNRYSLSHKLLVLAIVACMTSGGFTACYMYVQTGGWPEGAGFIVVATIFWWQMWRHIYKFKDMLKHEKLAVKLEKGHLRHIVDIIEEEQCRAGKR